ncbi:MAG TPA: D-alanyl-D-alanine carboxypeptidase, partial [Chitinophagaceae bacterium]|nr:D-alanyl-D-alanine carboxypeptidase [Chitinophagaceae bacterium]
MKRIYLLIVGFFLLSVCSFGQTVSHRLQQSYLAFENDSQLKNAISSLYVIDANTGQIIFNKNSRVGLAPASTQKIISSVSAYEILGKDFRYKTEFGINEKQDSRLYIFPSGDPTFGSWRWLSTSNDTLFKNLKNGLIKKEIHKITKVIIDNSGWDAESIPDGWIWQDIGNYYGAGVQKFNYREN